MLETAPTDDYPTAESPAEPPAPKSRWLLAVLTACGVSLPIGWLLCYGALLPFFLGLFFFLLFGLLLGAVLYRVGESCRPLGKWTIRAGTLVVVLFAWAISMLTEGHDFPAQVADYAYEQPRRLPEGVTPEDYRRTSEEQVVQFLREEYPPGGVIGYMRWAVTSSRVEPPVGQLRKPFRSDQFRWWFVIRVGLSILLLTYGVYSQTAPLGRLPRTHDRDGTVVNPLSKL